MKVARRTLAPGIYEDPYGREVRWVDGRTRSKRFALDAPLEDLKKFRARQVGQAKERQRAKAGGSFVRDCVRFLAGRKHKSCYKSDRAHLKPWIVRFRRGSRFAIERAGVQLAVDEWVTHGYSPREIRHRVKLLHQLFHQLDPGEKTPCDGVKLPKIGKSRKRPPVDALIVRDVALNLRKQEILGRLRDAKTRARFLVLALIGERPIQVERTTPADVDLANDVWRVPGAKGGERGLVALNHQQRAAWVLFAAAKAWGKYDRSSFSKTLRRNGWPKGVQPYQLRHTVAQTLKDFGVALDQIQDHLTHTTPLTTSDFYVGPSLPQLRQVSAKLEGRVDPFAVELPRITTTRSKKEKANKVEIAGLFTPWPMHKKRRPTGRLSKKSA